jgi:small GTP-binding protein
MNAQDEINRRRTFAIISHPDAGKTTLTEKLLLYGGAVQLAGTVTARKNQRATASDWMELEKKRGISISSTVLQFDYNGFRINLLDTPGHRDFSEDTYRVLTAVDAVIMVIDAAKGIESQTRKLFEVCRQRRVPIFTFINKLDRPTKEPLELIDELERVLDLKPVPFNWPLGTGQEFKGFYDRRSNQVHFFERSLHGAYKAPVGMHDINDPLIKERLEERTFANVVEEINMLEHVGATFDPAAVLRGEMTPVFFGSGRPRESLSRRTRRSRVSFLKFKATWIRVIAIGWRSCACVPGNLCVTCWFIIREQIRRPSSLIRIGFLDKNAKVSMRLIQEMWWDWWVIQNSKSATRSPKTRPFVTMKFPGFRPNVLRIFIIPIPPRINRFEKGWINFCWKESFRILRFAVAKRWRRYWPLSVRFNLKFFNIDWKVNMASKRGWSRHPGDFSGGWMTQRQNV